MKADNLLQMERERN